MCCDHLKVGMKCLAEIMWKEKHLAQSVGKEDLKTSPIDFNVKKKSLKS